MKYQTLNYQPIELLDPDWFEQSTDATRAEVRKLGHRIFKRFSQQNDSPSPGTSSSAAIHKPTL